MSKQAAPNQFPESSLLMDKGDAPKELKPTTTLRQFPSLGALYYGKTLGVSYCSTTASPKLRRKTSFNDIERSEMCK